MVILGDALAGKNADPAAEPLPTVAARPARATVTPRPALDTARLAMDMVREADIVRVRRVRKCVTSMCGKDLNPAPGAERERVGTSGRPARREKQGYGFQTVCLCVGAESQRRARPLFDGLSAVCFPHRGGTKSPNAPNAQSTLAKSPRRERTAVRWAELMPRHRPRPEAYLHTNRTRSPLHRRWPLSPPPPSPRCAPSAAPRRTSPAPRRPSPRPRAPPSRALAPPSRSLPPAASSGASLPARETPQRRRRESRRGIGARLDRIPGTRAARSRRGRARARVSGATSVRPFHAIRTRSPSRAPRPIPSTARRRLPPRSSRARLDPANPPSRPPRPRRLGPSLTVRIPRRVLLSPRPLPSPPPPLAK